MANTKKPTAKVNLNTESKEDFLIKAIERLTEEVKALHKAVDAFTNNFAVEPDTEVKAPVEDRSYLQEIVRIHTGG